MIKPVRTFGAALFFLGLIIRATVENEAGLIVAALGMLVAIVDVVLSRVKSRKSQKQ